MTSGKKLFESIDYDEEGRYLIMHHNSAGKYYKINICFLLLFLGTSIWSWKQNSGVFWNDRFAKVYISLVASSIIGLWIFANKHVNSIYLLKG